MAAYILVNVKVTDPERYATYRQLAQDAIAHHGGRYLARGGETVVLEFPTLEAAKVFYDSPEYRAARAARGGAATMSMVAVAGAAT